mmetsp:Transcript_3315/g.6922  ORF Transcript_3315/g.6922 Transcript_3315/m.6922 type:complete len:132 (+) Transcript_3315:209-604(+)|eukprot:CAMPEP_0168735278 /NCGR_PEP_ID=MMETSP0724-20121128/9250_1 /TAXON_ID=265536 /ORGANISM="Amphiprora sp., Strain CCMP467" /LENGTH=131 /DNA_ID=CAMNT_0008782415 /DNA_START=161 /DNA_END=556 /DNA_ORIENTATION=+
MSDGSTETPTNEHVPSLLFISLSLRYDDQDTIKESEVGFSRKFRRMKRQMLLNAVGKEQIQQKIDEELTKKSNFVSSYNDNIFVDGEGAEDSRTQEGDSTSSSANERKDATSRTSPTMRRNKKKAVAPAAA